MNTIQIDLNNEEKIIEVTENSQINAIYIGRGEDNIKTKLIIQHKKPGIYSRINIKAVVFNKAKFDLEALLKIEKGATDTNTYLKIDCLIMSESAFARAIPSLEINESEVKGGHGATIGYLDQDMLHYMLSRGISEQDAEEILVNAFINN